MAERPVNVRIEGRQIERLNRRLGQIDKRFKSFGLMTFARAIAGKAKENLRAAYVPDRAAQRTGNLESSIQAVSIQRGKIAAITASAKKDGFNYARTVEFQRGENPITPKNGKYLFFIGREGYSVRAKTVKRGEPKLFMTHAAEWGRQNISAYLKKRINRIVKSGGTVDDFNVTVSVK